MSEPGVATVRVWSSAGRLVRTLSSGRADGAVSSTWDLRDENGGRVAGGLYLVRLETAAGATELPVTVCR
jgi:flagellar hook assembly protein FlgD